MTFVLHAIIFGSNVVIAASAALMLPHLLSTLSDASAPVIGGIVFLLGAVFHLVFAQAEQRRVTRHQIGALHAAQNTLADHVHYVQEEASDLKGRVETLNEEGERRVKEVVGTSYGFAKRPVLGSIGG